MDHKDFRLKGATVVETLEVIASAPAWLWKQNREISAVLHGAALSASACAGSEVLQLCSQQSFWAVFSAFKPLSYIMV